MFLVSRTTGLVCSVFSSFLKYDGVSNSSSSKLMKPNFSAIDFALLLVSDSILFVTIDPERDTPEQLKLYLSSFDPAIIGLTGTQLQIDHIVKIYHAYAKRIDDGKGGYTMDHSTTIYKLQKDGGFLSTFKLK